jgi:hypothetical protein
MACSDLSIIQANLVWIILLACATEGLVDATYLPSPRKIALIGPSPGLLLAISSQQFPCYPSPIATNKVAH